MSELRKALVLGAVGGPLLLLWLLLQKLLERSEKASLPFLIPSSRPLITAAAFSTLLYLLGGPARALVATLFAALILLLEDYLERTLSC